MDTSQNSGIQDLADQRRSHQQVAQVSRAPQTAKTFEAGTANHAPGPVKFFQKAKPDLHVVVVVSLVPTPDLAPFRMCFPFCL